MIKKYNSKEEKIAAFKQAVALRERWEEAIKSKKTRSEISKSGLNTIPVTL